MLFRSFDIAFLYYAVQVALRKSPTTFTGKAVLRKDDNFQNFLLCNSLAFGISIALIFNQLLILVVPSGNFPRLIKYAKCSTRPILGLSIFSMIFAFSLGLGSVLDEKSNLTNLILLFCTMPFRLLYVSHPLLLRVRQF